MNSKLIVYKLSLYIHGGRDLKEGPIASMWRVNLYNVHKMSENENQQVEWECVKTSGTPPGKISHHSAVVVN